MVYSNATSDNPQTSCRYPEILQEVRQMVSYHKFFEVSQAQDVATLEQRLIDFAGELGFGLVGAIAITDHVDRESDYVMVNNAPQGFVDATRNVDDSRRDPVLKKLKDTSLPFVY